MIQLEDQELIKKLKNKIDRILKSGLKYFNTEIKNLSQSEAFALLEYIIRDILDIFNPQNSSSPKYKKIYLFKFSSKTKNLKKPAS